MEKQEVTESLLAGRKKNGYSFSYKYHCCHLKNNNNDNRQPVGMLEGWSSDFLLCYQSFTVHLGEIVVPTMETAERRKLAKCPKVTWKINLVPSVKMRREGTRVTAHWPWQWRSACWPN